MVPVARLRQTHRGTVAQNLVYMTEAPLAAVCGAAEEEATVISAGLNGSRRAGFFGGCLS